MGTGRGTRYESKRAGHIGRPSYLKAVLTALAARTLGFIPRVPFRLAGAEGEVGLAVYTEAEIVLKLFNAWVCAREAIGPGTAAHTDSWGISSVCAARSGGLM